MDGGRPRFHAFRTWAPLLQRKKKSESVFAEKKGMGEKKTKRGQGMRLCGAGGEGPNMHRLRKRKGKEISETRR